MAARVTSWLSRPGILRTLLAQARLAVRLVREPRVPWLVKTVPALALLYVLSPFDFVPDVLPVVGELDDLAVLVIAVELFVRICPAPAVEFHRTAIAGGRRFSRMNPSNDFIDAEWRRE